MTYDYINKMNKLAINIGSSFGSPLGQTRTLGDLVSLAINASFAIASVIIVFLLIMAGIGIISGAGNDNPESVKKGQQAATWAVIGFVIIFVAYWIIRILELITGVNFVTMPGL